MDASVCTGLFARLKRTCNTVVLKEKKNLQTSLADMKGVSSPEIKHYVSNLFTGCGNGKFKCVFRLARLDVLTHRD